ncbi:alpha-mannosidase 2C1-like isoform X2 [Tubulanus polymorphus]|uniref:alpha-mannosidase 2C1-like isoform X2 n=1 Tax=Tubulanus polymorphus TaxID=672921 RepID=UPI003DA4FC98
MSSEVYVEMACNGLFGVGNNGMINPPDLKKSFSLSVVEIRTFDRDVYGLLIDIEMLIGLAKHLPEDSNRSFQALYTVHDVVNTIKLDDKMSYRDASEIAKKFFAMKNGDSQHLVHAMGHCHIDSAWLWSYPETIRKCARSWASTIRLMQTYPDFTFVCSQAQQYDWVKKHYPELYNQIKHYVKEGRFIPVGGAWVEMDGNLPSGESFIRQFLYGQRFFLQEFNIKCQEFWLPDTFGYSAQLPQILNHVGIKRFVTQKLSWNLVNKFPHHTFHWEGIDGSEVIAHFPPGESYNMMGNIDELLKTVNNFEDKGRSNHSLFLFGYGDGGQGPTEEMLEKLKRVANVDGCPIVQMSSPDDYFHAVEANEADNLNRWVGELYLELHNGTYTTQAKTKEKNRKCEVLLHDIEFLASLAISRNQGNVYPSEDLQHLWQLLMLNQFHDVLPGSSIQEVYKDAATYYKEIETTGKRLIGDSLKTIFPLEVGSDDVTAVINTVGWSRNEVISLSMNNTVNSPARKKIKDDTSQTDAYGNTLIMVNVPSYGYSIDLDRDSINGPAKVGITRDHEYHFLKNCCITAYIDSLGRIVKLIHNKSGKNAIADDCYGNQFVIFDDRPLYWDAWDVMDYHLETRKPVEHPIQLTKILDEGPLRASVEVSVKISDQSYIKQVISLDAGSPYLRFDTEVHWYENRKFLKVEFPVNVCSMQATYEIQSGHFQRPTHFNTSWDWAKYEVCSHRWADLSEYNWGVSILNDSKYGFSTLKNVMRLSLLRSPKAPDDKADMGVHRFAYALMPHTGTFQDAGVIQQAYNMNFPLRLHSISKMESVPISSFSFFQLDTPAVILETIKKSEDCNNVLVLRFYEAFGSRTSLTLTTRVSLKRAILSNGMEEPLEDSKCLLRTDGSIKLNFKPFEIQTLLCYL